MLIFTRTQYTLVREPISRIGKTAETSSVIYRYWSKEIIKLLKYELTDRTIVLDILKLKNNENQD